MNGYMILILWASHMYLTIKKMHKTFISGHYSSEKNKNENTKKKKLRDSILWLKHK